MSFIIWRNGIHENINYAYHIEILSMLTFNYKDELNKDNETL